MLFVSYVPIIVFELCTCFTDKVKKKYSSMGPGVLMVQLEKGPQGLGLSLAGHKDRNRMAVFVCGINPKGSAHKTGAIHVGDEILEVMRASIGGGREGGMCMTHL